MLIMQIAFLASSSHFQIDLKPQLAEIKGGSRMQKNRTRNLKRVSKIYASRIEF